MDKHTLYLTDTLHKTKRSFVPIDPLRVTMYSCGPTVYQAPHVGNLRAAVTNDLLLRVLRSLYKCVTFVRNITDVNEKILHAFHSQQVYSDINHFTESIIASYHHDLKRLNCLQPDVEPRVSTSMTGIIRMIERLLDNRSAYIAENGDVLFSVESDKNYGCLSNRKLEEMEFGTRKLHDGSFKRHPADFVLWKKCANMDELPYSFPSPWHNGTPGWHIECSAMSYIHLGQRFDIHCGGVDLLFPHHENERAQSSCANGFEPANYWVHNGLLTMAHGKMSKSEGNIMTMDDILKTGVQRGDLKYFLLSTHYRKPLDYNAKAISDVQKFFDKIRGLQRYYCVYDNNIEQYFEKFCRSDNDRIALLSKAMDHLYDDLNMAKVNALLNGYLANAKRGSEEDFLRVLLFMDFLGIPINS